MASRIANPIRTQTSRSKVLTSVLRVAQLILAHQRHLAEVRGQIVADDARQPVDRLLGVLT